MCGGHSQQKQDTDGKILTLVQKHQSDLETNLKSSVNKIEVVSFTTQVVNGTNYTITVKLNGEHNAKLVIYEKLPCYGGETSLTSFTKV